MSSCSLQKKCLIVVALYCIELCRLAIIHINSTKSLKLSRRGNYDATVTIIRYPYLLFCFIINAAKLSKMLLILHMQQVKIITKNIKMKLEASTQLTEIELCTILRALNYKQQSKKISPFFVIFPELSF